jgi:hypothetical protein
MDGIRGLRRDYYGAFVRLVQCSLGKDVLYSAESAVGIRAAQSHEPAHDALFDLQGRRLSGTPRRGLYIRDGKKCLVGR